MTPALVLDCSATLPWIFQDEATEATDRLLDDLTAGAEAWVPALWHLELGNVLIGAQRRGRIDQAGIEGFFSRLGAYEISVDTETIPRAWNKTLDLALLHQLSTYDAAYLELALRRDLPLASLDTALIRAAKATGVTLCLP
ncbi:putative nucleic acid-binding protein [Opitutaceae bacterium TAV1]|nr:putative nucleic acid-binding protein [Opitutaceae bacterium TAV1]